MVVVRSASSSRVFLAGSTVTNGILVKTNRFAYRLNNTAKSIGQLATDGHAILLDNALVDTTAKMDLKIPAHLRAGAQPGAYIVQARGAVDASFRAALAGAGAQIVSYIPNNAYLVQLSAAGAGVLEGNALVQAVLPFEPYFKLQASLLGLAVQQKALPPQQVLTLGLFDNGAAATLAQIQKLGGIVLASDRSPFGPIVRVRPPADWIALAQLPGVQRVEPTHRRVTANDLSRVTTGVAVDTITNANWLGLSGSNVLVEVNDTGIDATHPDFTATGSALTGPAGLTRVAGDTNDSPNSLVDTDGHGTHVAGIIAGNGSVSINPTNVGAAIASYNEGSVTNADFRGKAPLANLYSFGFLGANDTNIFYSDALLQEIPALTNALISNNSWVNDGDSEYDLSAASYDAAVRDALPEVTGSQPVLFVFAAGNDGAGNNGGGGGNPDSISSPGTAKNVITVGALEQLRNITNTYTPLGSTNQVAAWLPGTDSSSQVAWYSARGNVGIGTEGTYGRYKPDVVAPGTFVVSTRSSQWDQMAYYNPTNYYNNYALDQTVDTNGLNYYSFSDFGFVVKPNAVSVSLQILFSSPVVTNMPFYVSLNNFPDPATPSTYDFVTQKNGVTIPADGGAGYLASIIGNAGNFNFGVGDPTNVPVTYDMSVQMITTNDLGNYYTVLSNLNQTIGPYYRYETGTSMAAADVSGVLALMQDFFTNTLQVTPSPALLKAMLINGSRPTGFYNFQVNNNINFQGWGLINLPDSIPLGITNTTAGINQSEFFIDQSPTNALATGDSRTYTISLSPGAQNVPLRLTLAWTDPPGNPVAAIKLVNNLDLIVTNTDNPTNPIIYYGNDIAANQVFNTQENSTNASVVLDTVNNVKNVFLPAFAGTHFTVVIYGTAVNVNAVNTQTNNPAGGYAPNIVQDFAFVMSSGNGSNTNGFSITSATLASNPTGDQRITVVVSTNSPLMNQMVGAASPVMATNYLALGNNSPYANNAQLTIGQTNQWHFYIVTNKGPNAHYINAAFVTFLPATLSLPREGVFAGTDANSTRPEADIDLFVASSSTAAGLTNLDPIVISNCLSGSAIGQTSNNRFYAASLSRGGTEVIVDSSSTPGQVYYIGVKSEDQTAAEYDFLPEFSSTPFSQMTTNGEVVQMFPVDIPDGNATLPGYTNTIGLAIYPIDTRRVIVTNILAQQNVGDLVISLDHSSVSGGNGQVVLMNHDSPNAPGIYKNIYDDSGQGDVVGSQPSDGPGSLQNFARHSGQGVWIMHAADNAPGFVGNVQGTLLVQPHQDLKNGIQVTIQPGTWFYDYIEVPVGYTNLLVAATNITLPPSISQPVQLYLNYNTQPTFSNYLAEVDLTNGIPPGNSISYGPPLTPGTYYVGLFNSSLLAQTVYIIDTLSFNSSAISTVDYASTGPVPLKDDAVTYAYITNFDRADTIQNFNVGLRVDHQRISDLSFTLVSPDGTRYLLMENRGGQSTNGCGATVITTNITPVSSSGGSTAVANFIPVGLTSGSVNISYNMFTVPDQMAVYYSTNPTPANLITNFFTSGAGQITVSFPPTGVPASSTFLTIVMNPTNQPTRTFWNYTVGGVQTNYYYLDFTEDTNLTTTPIKYAVPPFVPNTVSGILWTDNFDAYSAGTYLTNPAPAFGNWTVLTNQVEIINTNPPANSPPNALSLDNGAVAITLPNTVAGQTYLLQYEQGSSGSDITNSPSTNANWQVVSYVFTATQNNQLLLLDATGSATFSSGFNNAVVRTFVTNTVLDDFQLTTVPSNLYYQPEQDVSPLNGTSAAGLWTLEVLDNRVGATNNAVLDSWSLGFTFANTNFTIPNVTFTNGIGPITNSLPGGATAWYLITVPTNADFATNSLIFATLPLNLWFSTNVPPTTTNLGDVLLLPNSTGGNSVLSTNGSSINPSTAYIIPGGTYYLGVQNSNTTVATYAVNVTFHLLPSAPQLYTQPASGVLDVSATLNAVAIPNGLPTTVYFGYGSTTNYNFFSTSTVITNNLTVSNLVAAGVSNLSPGAVYHFQAVGTNALGTNYGGDLTFTNFSDAPSVITEPATNITATTATLEALLNPGGAATELYFQYGLTTNSLTNFSTALLFTNNLNATNYWGIGITNLTPGTVYYFQAIATNSTGTNYGGILSFTNLFAGPLPYAFTAPATLATGANGMNLSWAAPIYDQFQIQWTTNLTPVVNWTTLPNIITSTSGAFSFTDTNVVSSMKFYRLILLP